MRCNLCGKPTAKIFETSHPECEKQFQNEMLERDNIIGAYVLGELSRKDAVRKFMETSSTAFIQKRLWHAVPSHSDIRTYEQLLYSYAFVEVSEEKNRCRMERTGLSYAKYPRWKVSKQKICSMARFILTNGGIYFLDSPHFYIPYNKIVDIGINKYFTKKEIYFEVKSTSPHRHRYFISPIQKSDMDFASDAFAIIRLMAGIGTHI